LAEEHRELARQQLKLLLKAGYSPLRFYLHDIKKYFYLGELLSVVDLSLVRLQGPRWLLVPLDISLSCTCLPCIFMISLLCRL
jgi:hypothetical protein